MIKTVFTLLSIACFALQMKAQQESIRWMKFEDALILQTKAPRKWLIDMYTDWCGWCKRMDAATFNDPQVAEFVNKHFYAIKFNAEKEGPVTVGERTYKLQEAPQGRRASHELAIELMNGKMSYPTIVYLDENLSVLSPVPGFMTPTEIEKVLRYFGEDHYKTSDWQTFSAQFKGQFK